MVITPLIRPDVVTPLELTVQKVADVQYSAVGSVTVAAASVVEVSATTVEPSAFLPVTVTVPLAVLPVTTMCMYIKAPALVAFGCVVNDRDPATAVGPRSN